MNASHISFRSGQAEIERSLRTSSASCRGWELRRVFGSHFGEYVGELRRSVHVVIDGVMV